MNGYDLIDRPRCTPYYYRSIEPTAASLAEALAVLPPFTAIEVQAGAEQVGDPTYVTYTPSENRASIG
jgi:hypothetical protein